MTETACQSYGFCERRFKRHSRFFTWSLHQEEAFRDIHSIEVYFDWPEDWFPLGHVSTSITHSSSGTTGSL